MISNEIGHCPLCGNHYYQPTRNGLLRCRTCTVVLNRQVWDKGANAAHEEEWFDNKYVLETFWTGLFQSWNNRRTWWKLNGRLPARARLLEIGVGTGSLLRFLRDRNIEVEGCDLSRSVCERIKDVDGIPMYNCPVAQIPHSAPYDVVVMHHVLEHVNEPVQFLKDVRTLLGRAGIVIIRVPNVFCCEAHLPGWNSYEPYHLVYFSPATLRRAVEQAGFEVLRIGTHESFSGWFLALLRTLLRTNQKTAGERFAQREAAHLSWVGHAYRLAMVLSGVITLPLRFLQGAIGRGDEVVLIARKVE